MRRRPFAHGTEAGYGRHLQRDEAPCDDCMSGHAAYSLKNRAPADPLFPLESEEDIDAALAIRRRRQAEWAAEHPSGDEAPRFLGNDLLGFVTPGRSKDRERRREADVRPSSDGPPAFEGYYATDGYGLAIAQMDESGHWLDVDRAIYAPMTYRQSQRPPESFEAPPLSAEETAVWKERCRAVMRGELLVTEGELGEAVELTEAETGEVVWAAVS